MQASAAMRTASAAGFSGRSTCPAAPLAQTPRRCRGGRAPTRVVHTAALDLDTVGLVSQLATTAALAAGAFMLLSQQDMAPEQDGMEQRNACPVCQGTGFEECMCTRWSDGDVGCSSCSKTGYMRCRGCGGGGKAVPLLVKVRRD